jgi:hypothetical protein
LNTPYNKFISDYKDGGRERRKEHEEKTKNNVLFMKPSIPLTFSEEEFFCRHSFSTLLHPGCINKQVH